MAMNLKRFRNLERNNWKFAGIAGAPVVQSRESDNRPRITKDEREEKRGEISIT